MQDLILTPDEFDEIRTEEKPFFCPDPAGIKKGDRFSLWVKIGGEQDLSSVIIAKGPYTKGKTALYVDVFGYGINKAVNVKKLLQAKRPDF